MLVFRCIVSLRLFFVLLAIVRVHELCFVFLVCLFVRSFVFCLEFFTRCAACFCLDAASSYFAVFGGGGVNTTQQPANQNPFIAPSSSKPPAMYLVHHAATSHLLVHRTTSFFASPDKPFLARIHASPLYQPVPPPNPHRCLNPPSPPSSPYPRQSVSR